MNKDIDTQTAPTVNKVSTSGGIRSMGPAPIQIASDRSDELRKRELGPDDEAPKGSTPAPATKEPDPNDPDF